MSETLNLKLTEIFPKNAFNLIKRPSITHSGDNSHYKGNNFYVWDLDADPALRECLEEGQKWVHGSNGFSISRYAKVTDYVYDKCWDNCIMTGPNTNTRTQTMEIDTLNGKSRVRVKGWGHSYVQVWEGETEELIKFIEENKEEKNVGAERSSEGEATNSL